jgi:hypothetical protein
MGWGKHVPEIAQEGFSQRTSITPGLFLAESLW